MSENDLEKNVPEQSVEAEAHTAEAEKSTGVAEIDSGRFRSVRDLQSAYNALEKEFTRKCQELNLVRRKAEVHSTNPADLGVHSTNPVSGEVKSSQETEVQSNNPKTHSTGVNCFSPDLPCTGQGNSRQDTNSMAIDDIILAASNEHVKDLVIKRYLSKVGSRGTVRLMGGNDGGSFAVTPEKSPKTIQEAGDLAKKYFK